MYYTEDGEPVNIEDEKIYWDTQKNQFRHKFECCECKEPLGCRCYDTLLSALTGVEEGIICESCGMSEALGNLFISDILDIFDEHRIKQVNEYLATLITEEDIKKYMEDAEVTRLDGIDNMEIIEGTEKEDILREFVISLMTKEEKMDEFYEGCDGYAEGESCNI